MKRVVILFCLVALLLAGCTGQDKVYTTEVNGVTYTVDTEAGTITGDSITCWYSVSGDKNSITLRFPDGTTMSERKLGNGTISRNGNVSMQYFSVSSEFSRIAWDSIRSGMNVDLAVSAAVVLILGIWMICKPGAFWLISHGWWYKNVEPSDRLLASYQTAGAVMIFASVIMFIISLGG